MTKLSTGEAPALNGIRRLSESDLLNYFKDNGIIDNGSIQNAIMAKKKDIVKKVHPYRIYQGTGRDQRWFTYIEDDKEPGKRKKVGKQTEEALIGYLFDHYNLSQSSKRNIRLPDCYEDWRSYKLATANRVNTVRRLDTDYKRFYVNEPLSEPIMNKPLRKLSKADIEVWCYEMIKRYDMTRKAFANMITILRQVYEFLIDQEVLSENPVMKIRIRPTAFRKVRKKPADTQVFFHDEAEQISERAKQLAKEHLDENYLAIPLFFETGIRIGECMGLSFEDFDRESGTVHVHCSFVTKDELLPDGSWATRKYEVEEYLKQNADERDVVVPDSCFELLKEIKKIKFQNGRVGSRLFEAKTPADIQLKLHRICHDLGITQRSPHKIRKTYISTLLNQGFDPDFVREQAGHQDLKTTLNCYTFSTTRREENREKLNKIGLSS